MEIPIRYQGLCSRAPSIEDGLRSFTMEKYVFEYFNRFQMNASLIYNFLIVIFSKHLIPPIQSYKKLLTMIINNIIISLYFNIKMMQNIHRVDV
jgi:hypothetical protein